MKRWLSVLLASVLVLAMSACGGGEVSSQAEEVPPVTEATGEADPQEESGEPEPAGEGAFVPGTYTGESSGYGGKLVVAVTVSEDAITGVEVTEHSETQGVGTNAVDRLPGRIVETQSIGLDAVAGCTLTSNAILEATGEALEQAGGDLEALKAAPVSDSGAAGESQTLTYDVVIVGAGGAGMTAAAAAAGEGASVVVVEKMASVGGATSICGASLQAAGSQYQAELDPEDSADLIYEDLMTGGNNYSDPDLLRVWVDNAGDTFDYLTEAGVSWTGPRSLAEHSRDRVFNADGGASSIIAVLKDAMEASGAELMLETKAEELILEDGAVVGVLAEGADGTQYRIEGKVVILATGGFGANRDMQPEYLQKAPYYGHVSSTGDGQRMAQAVGAQLKYMDFGKVYPTGIEVEPGKAKSTQPATLAAYTGTGTILVNLDGVRVCNEAGYLAGIREQIIAQDNGTLYKVMDSQAFEQWRTKVVEEDNLLSYEEIDTWLANDGASAPIFAHGDTIEEVAAKVGIDGETLASTVERYNGFVAAGNDEDFGRAVTLEIGEGPYYIIEQKLRFATTLGGVSLNTNFQVLDEDGQPIPGLYAAGEVVAGAHGDDTLVGTAISWAMTSGRLAGAEAAKAIQE